MLIVYVFIFSFHHFNASFCGFSHLFSLIFFSSFLFIADFVAADIYDSHFRGPSFVMEPPARLDFSNSSGGWLDCSASGIPQPTIDWLSIDGTSIGDVNGVRRVLRNGTLVLLPFQAAAYRQDIHNTIYRCVASNAVGRIISRDVQVRAGKCNILSISHSFVWVQKKRKIDRKKVPNKKRNKN